MCAFVLSGGSQLRTCACGVVPKAARCPQELLVVPTLPRSAAEAAQLLSLGRRAPGFGGHHCSLSLPLTGL